MALGNDPSDIGNDPDSGGGIIAASAAPAGTVIGPFPISYAPDANAAFTVTPGTLIGGVFLAGLVTYGPYLATATQALSIYNLTGTATDTLLPGEVSVQPGDLSGGVFSPIGPAVTGTLGGDVLPDVSLAAGPPLASLTNPGQPLPAGSGGYIHILVSAVLNADGSAADLTPFQVSLAITFVGPQAADYQAGNWLVVTAPPGVAGTYARLRVSAAAGNLLTAGSYFVYVQIGDQAVCADGILTATE